MMFFKVEQKETRYLGYMSNKICHQEFSKIAPIWSHWQQRQPRSDSKTGHFKRLIIGFV